jgi:hypothetical protein
MGRLVIPTLAVAAAAVTAILFGTVAHDDLGIAVDTIRTDALSGAGFMIIVVACTNLLRRNR